MDDDVASNIRLALLPGPKTITIDKGTPWTVCLPGTGTGPGEICDRGINSATSKARGLHSFPD